MHISADVETKRVRRVVRSACFIAAVLALLPATARCWSAVIVPSLSPLVAAASAVVVRSFQPTMVLGLCVAVTAIVRRRWFCRWMCPTGLCVDGASRLGLRLGRRCPKLPRMGSWIAWIALGGAILGYPALLWLDPLALFSGVFGVSVPGLSATAWIAVLGLPSVMALSLILPGAWCGRVCPLGGFQETIHIAIPRRHSAQPRSETSVRTARRRLLRHVCLGGMIGSVWAITAQRMRIAVQRPLRPPGAMKDDTSFLGLCVRCGNCIRVCPSHIIEYDGGSRGMAGLLAPIVRFREDYCREDCVRCMAVCPSGALARQSLAEREPKRIGLPKVDMHVCLLGDDQECAVCRSVCPYQAVSYVFSEADYTLTPVVDASKCPGCGACEAACPTQPIKAIQVFSPQE